MVYYLEKMETKEGVQAFIDFSKPILEAHQVKALVCTGVSGLIAAAPMAYALDLGLIVVRKKNESSHSSSDIEIPSQFRVMKRKDVKWMLVDDLICSGDTIERCIETVREHRFLSENLCGALLYRQFPDRFTFRDREYLVGDFI